MDRDSFASANSSPPIKISRGTQNELFNNCNLFQKNTFLN